MTSRPSTTAPILAVLAVVLWAGAAEELSPPKFGELNKVRKLPDHWEASPKHEFVTDSDSGWFASSELKLRVVWEMGTGGEWASAARNPGYKWRRTGRIGKTEFSYLLSKDNRLYMTFPKEGPWNLYADVKTDEEIAYVLELVGRHRYRLLERRKPRSVPAATK